MPSINPLNRSMYHMSHLDNLRNILSCGALLSQHELEKNDVRARSIANLEVQELRKRIYIWDFVKKQYRALHSYVPFYFTTNTPMFRNQSGIVNDIIFFEVSTAYIGTIDHSVLFTDGNASNQQLSKYSGEKVYIEPMTPTNPSCIRKYVPGGPYGTNANLSNFYANEAFLDRVRWDVIDGSTFVDDREEYKRVKHAEALAPDVFPLDEMLYICVKNTPMLEAVRNIFTECGLTEDNFDLQVICKPHLFSR